MHPYYVVLPSPSPQTHDVQSFPLAWAVESVSTISMSLFHNRHDGKGEMVVNQMVGKRKEQGHVWPSSMCHWVHTAWQKVLTYMVFSLVSRQLEGALTNREKGAAALKSGS